MTPCLNTYMKRDLYIWKVTKTHEMPCAFVPMCPCRWHMEWQVGGHMGATCNGTWNGRWDGIWEGIWVPHVKPMKCLVPLCPCAHVTDFISSKRDLYIWKVTKTHEMPCAFVPMWPISLARKDLDLFLPEQNMTPYLHTYMKRDLYLWKEIYTHEKPCAQDSFGRVCVTCCSRTCSRKDIT